MLRGTVAHTHIRAGALKKTNLRLELLAGVPERARAARVGRHVLAAQHSSVRTLTRGARYAKLPSAGIAGSPGT